MFDPPPGMDDMLSDAQDAPKHSGPFYPLEVEGVGTVLALKPGPDAIPLLAMISAPGTSPEDSMNYLSLFVQTHTPPDWYEEMLIRMIEGDAPVDTMQRCMKAIATAGTARPYMAVMNLSVTAAHHWRMFRSRYHSQGIHDPMSLGSMHAVLDDVEALAVESAAQGAKTNAEAKSKISRFYDSLYASLAEETRNVPVPSGFSVKEQEASFDAMVKALR